MSSEPADVRAQLLASISGQFSRLVARVADDVAKYADSTAGPAGTRSVGGGFVIYYLSEESGEPLKDTSIADVGLTVSDIERSAGFTELKGYCERLALNLRLDEHFYSDDPRPTKIFRVVVDGWA